MADLKKITEVPEVEALKGTEKVLLNVDGSARQAKVELIKPKEEWDLDIVINKTWNTENDYINEPVFTVNENYSYESFVAKVNAGEIPKVKIKTDIAISPTQHMVELIQNPVVAVIDSGIGHPFEGYSCTWYGNTNISPEGLILTPDGFEFIVM